MKLRKLLAVCGFVTLLLPTQDLHCLIYTGAAKLAGEQSIQRQREFQQFKASTRGKPPHAATAFTPRANFIDNYVFRDIEADHIPLARSTTISSSFAA